MMPEPAVFERFSTQKIVLWSIQKRQVKLNTFEEHRNINITRTGSLDELVQHSEGQLGCLVRVLIVLESLKIKENLSSKTWFVMLKCFSFLFLNEEFCQYLY